MTGGPWLNAELWPAPLPTPNFGALAEENTAVL